MDNTQKDASTLYIITTMFSKKIPSFICLLDFGDSMFVPASMDPPIFAVYRHASITWINSHQLPSCDSTCYQFYPLLQSTNLFATNKNFSSQGWCFVFTHFFYKPAPPRTLPNKINNGHRLRKYKASNKPLSPNKSERQKDGRSKIVFWLCSCF